MANPRAEWPAGGGAVHHGLMAQPMPDWPARAAGAGPPSRAPLALALAVYIVSVAVPVAWLNGIVPPLCLFHHVTGLPCPFCGLTRAFLCMGHGDVFAAFRHHALGPPVYGAGIIWIANAAIGRPWPGPRAARWGTAAPAGGFLLYGVARMLCR